MHRNFKWDFILFLGRQKYFVQIVMIFNVNFFSSNVYKTGRILFKIGAYINFWGLPPLPLKNKKLWKHVGSMKPKKERIPSNQISFCHFGK
jgi:hypothetical protein